MKSLTASALIRDAYNRQAELHAEKVQRTLGYSIGALKSAPAARHRRTRLDELAAELETLVPLATTQTWNFSHLFQVQAAIVRVAFLRPGNDQADTDNPIYNALVWLTEALTDAGALARLNVTGVSVERISEA